MGTKLAGIDAITTITEIRFKGTGIDVG